ncbi:cytochrome c biogenesis protein CcdA [uncultured Roseovarius sp.]|uniref:cytochrome c biogenesis CcdA family protein n=1 Tax=uncultured Roseovarius sp. TaxID=293344 RepID=UPI0026264AD9|nr:cytochrome c biogenesis protein CcdA [uncultured Roseovarius sp.]
MPDFLGIGVLATFLAGVISFVSPCVLPLVPGYVSYVAGQTAPGHAHRARPVGRFVAILLSLYFVLGFSTVFMILGASATALGQLMLSYRYELNIAGGVIVILFGLLMIGMVRISAIQRDWRFHLNIPGGKPFSAYILGLAFGFGWTPCIGPILGAILTATAAASTISEGIVMLAVYSAGLGIPFLLAAAFTDRLLRRVRMIGQVGRWLQMFAGVVIIAMGFAMMTGRLSAFSYWLLGAFPVLGRIG